MSSTLATALARLSGVDVAEDLAETVVARMVATSRAFDVVARGLAPEVPAQR